MLLAAQPLSNVGGHQPDLVHRKQNRPEMSALPPTPMHEKKKVPSSFYFVREGKGSIIISFRLRFPCKSRSAVPEVITARHARHRRQAPTSRHSAPTRARAAAPAELTLQRAWAAPASPSAGGRAGPNQATSNQATPNHTRLQATYARHDHDDSTSQPLTITRNRNVTVTSRDVT